VLYLFVASIGSTVVAAGLYSLCRGITQAHLGAFRAEYAGISPVRLLDDTARRWAMTSGARVFHLGGGVGGRQDSLFQYKAGFSDRRHEFATWQWVVDEKTYQRLCREREGRAGSRGWQEVDTGYFPAYRRAVETGP
jgi:Acetyltransferase (GNAT) domain